MNKTGWILGIIGAVVIGGGCFVAGDSYYSAKQKDAQIESMKKASSKEEKERQSSESKSKKELEDKASSEQANSVSAVSSTSEQNNTTQSSATEAENPVEKAEKEAYANGATTYTLDQAISAGFTDEQLMNSSFASYGQDTMDKIRESQAKMKASLADEDE